MKSVDDTYCYCRLPKKIWFHCVMQHARIIHVKWKKLQKVWAIWKYNHSQINGAILLEYRLKFDTKYNTNQSKCMPTRMQSQVQQCITRILIPLPMFDCKHCVYILILCECVLISNLIIIIHIAKSEKLEILP